MSGVNAEADVDVEQAFLEAARRRSEFLRLNKPQKANREYDRIYKLKNRLRLLPDRGETMLKRISLNDDPEVRMTAAAALLAVDEPFAVKIFEDIAKDNKGLCSFTAEMTLSEWRSGRLNEYWT